MTTPMRPVPAAILSWIDRRRWLRWVDALLAWLILVGLACAWLGSVHVQAISIVVLVLIIVVGMTPLRLRWRPISGWIGLRLSRGLRPGDRAWYVGAREAMLVLVTACHGVRMTIVRPDQGQDEGLSVRRTRVFLIAADGPGPGGMG
jgi:hypothetical protein